MATNKTVIAPGDSKFGFIEVASFGGAVAQDAVYTMIESGIPTIDTGVTQVQEPRHGRGRGYDINDGYISEASGERIISVPEHPVRRKDLADYVYAVAQTVSEAVGDPYKKTFAITNTTTQPDFNANAGYFADLYIDNGIAGSDTMFKSAILRSLTLSANTSEGDGRLMAAMEWLSGFGGAYESASLTGAPVYSAQNYYEFSKPSLQQIEAVDVVVANWTITITNGATRVGNTSNGECETYACGFPYAVEGSITVKWDATTDNHFADWVAGTAKKIQLSTGTDDVAGYFDIAMDKCEFTGNERDYNNVKGQMVTLPFKAGFNTSSNNLIDIEVDPGGADRTW